MNGRHFITIHNAGPGIAKQVCFVVFGESEKCIGVVPWPSGFLKAGEEITTEMMFKGSLPRIAKAVVSCRDHLEYPRYWTLSNGGNPHVYKRFNWRRFQAEPDPCSTVEARAAELIGGIENPDDLAKVNFGLRDATEEFLNLQPIRRD